MKELNGKIAIVTGSSRGCGRGVAIELAKVGCNVVVNYHGNKKCADEVVEELTAFGVKAVAIQADVSNEASVISMFKKTIEIFGRLDILVNNAGTSKAQDIFETTEEDWDFIVNTNLKSGFLCCKEAMKIMRDQKGGHIVNISSVTGHRGALFGFVHYASTKSGQFGMTKTLARTGAPYGIRVNTVAPGLIETELLHETLSPEKLKELTDDVPLGLGQISDIGLAVVYLCGPGGRYVTGATIDVNGGIYMR